MSIIIGSIGTRITITSEVTFPNGFTYLIGSDNKAIFSITYARKAIEEVYTGGNYKAVFPVPGASYAELKLSSLIGTDEDDALQVITRYAYSAQIERIEISLKLPGTNGRLYVFKDGNFSTQENGPVSIPDASGRIDSNSYVFNAKVETSST
jgi:hypothetical protein